MKKESFILIVSLLAFYESPSQYHSTFGKGIITIAQCGIPPSGKVPDLPLPSSVLDNGYSFTYYIKGWMILRKDKQESIANEQLTQTNTESGDNTLQRVTLNLTTKVLHHSYLIDWENRMVYNYYQKEGKELIAAKTLKDQTVEWFYRLFDNDSALQEFEKDNDKDTVLILGRKSLKAIGTLKDGTAIVYYYTTEPLKVHSPLNAYGPHNFPFDILYVRVQVPWTLAGGKMDTGTLILQVTNIEESKVADSLFKLPPKENIQYNVPSREIFFSDTKKQP